MYKYIYNCIYALVPELCSYLAGILWIPIIFFGSVWDGMSSEKRRKARGSRAWSGPRNQRGPESPSPGRSLEAMIFFSKGDGVFRWVAVICTNQFSRFSHWESILFTSQFEELLTGATGEQHVNSVAEITSRVHQILRNYPQSLSQSSIHHWSGWMKIRHQQKTGDVGILLILTIIYGDVKRWCRYGFYPDWWQLQTTKVLSRNASHAGKNHEWKPHPGTLVLKLWMFIYPHPLTCEFSGCTLFSDAAKHDNSLVKSLFQWLQPPFIMFKPVSCPPFGWLVPVVPNAPHLQLLIMLCDAQLVHEDYQRPEAKSTKALPKT
jgi:hypothetical protein